MPHNTYQSQNCNLMEVHNIIDVEDGGSAHKLKETFDQLSQSKCQTWTQS